LPHQPTAVLIELNGRQLDENGRFGPQCRGHHLPGTVADNRIEQ
jgi:hypothetical protein